MACPLEDAGKLKPRQHQHQVGCARRQQRKSECDMHALAEGVEGRSHDRENIRRFYPGSLGNYFFGDSGLIYDSKGLPARNGPRRLVHSGVITGFAPVETRSHPTR